MSADCCGHTRAKHASHHGGGHDCHSGGGFDWLMWGGVLVVGALYVMGWQRLGGPGWLVAMAQTSFEMMNAMWWGVLVGAFFVGLMGRVPRDMMMAVLGRGGTLGGILRATGAGVLLDLCNHGILLIAAKLYERGASAGQVIAFLLASPWNSFSMTLIMIGLMGWKLTAVFIGLSLIVAVVAGGVLDAMVALGWVGANPNKVTLPKGFKLAAEVRRGLRQADLGVGFWRGVVVDGVKESQMVVRWLLVGVLLAGVLRAVMGDGGMYGEYLGPTAMGLLLTLLLASVMEICSEGTTPVAADLVSKAHAPGNAFAFLMAGVATNYTAMLVLRQMTGGWKVPLLLPLLTVPQVVVLAWLLNQSW
ncbi:MAG: ATPase [Proteobacteria bacterium]|nr:ATPase [Pseudomonadota bacterium]